MAMIPFNTDARIALKWMHTNAPNLTSLINQKAAWYSNFTSSFWNTWYHQVFNALYDPNPSAFGLIIWAIILGIPPQAVGAGFGNVEWAFGTSRKNFVWNHQTLPGGGTPETAGGNFFGGATGTILSVLEVQWMLRIRYYALTCNGSTQQLNRALQKAFKELTGAQQPYVINNHNMSMVYRFPSNNGTPTLSPNFVNSDNTYQFMPRNAGISYTFDRS